MTIVCCWLDRSQSIERVVGLADGRASTQRDNTNFDPYVDATPKLFRILVRCFDLDFQPATGLPGSPYYETEIGIGFAGQCFEAMSIIALGQRCLATLTDTMRTGSRPSHDGIVNLVRVLSDRFFQTHRRPDRQDIDLIVYGYCPTSGEPRASHIRHRRNTATTTRSLSLTGNGFHVIGSAGGESDFSETIEKLTKHIERHKVSIKKRMFDDYFEFELEKSKHENAKAGAIENSVLSLVLKDTFGDLGGVLEKLEAFKVRDKAVTSYTSDSRPNIFEGLPSVNSAGLAFMPVTQNLEDSYVPNIDVDAESPIDDFIAEIKE